MASVGDKSARKRNWKVILFALCGFGVLIPLAFVTCFIVSLFTDRPLEGIHDYDERLTLIAKTAGPIIEQAKSFYAKQRRYPTDAELRELVKDPRLSAYSPADLGNSVWASGFQGMRSWNYSVDVPNEFWLVYRFSYSQALKYHYDGVKETWFYYNENDDSEKPISLHL
jgi:hypothetical protein